MPINPRVVAACRMYAATFGEPSAVFYPGCGNDASPTEAFPHSSVVFLDPVQGGLDEIQREYPTAVIRCERAEEAPEGARYDLVIDVHSHAPLMAEVRDLKRGGHLLIANKMSDAAFDLPQLFKLVGAIHVLSDDTVKIDQGDLEKYYEVDPEHQIFSFSNSRLIKAEFYVFERVM